MKCHLFQTLPPLHNNTHVIFFQTKKEKIRYMNYIQNVNEAWRIVCEGSQAQTAGTAQGRGSNARNCAQLKSVFLIYSA